LRMCAVSLLEFFDFLGQAEHAPRHALHAFLTTVSLRAVHCQFHQNECFVEPESQAGGTLFPYQPLVKNVAVNSFSYLLDITPVKRQHIIATKSRGQFYLA